MKKTLIYLLIGVTVWRLGLFLVGLVAGTFFFYNPSFPYAYTLLPSYGLPQWLYSWANFDGVHYLTIVGKGYVGTGLIQAFFPGYPMIVSLVNYLVGNAQLSGLLVSTIFLYLCMALWIILLKGEAQSLKGSEAQRFLFLGTLIVLLFPSAFFLGALYSESFFLSLVFGSFLAARYKLWWLAGILAGLASGTRVVGIVLVPALLIEYLVQLNLSPTLYRLTSKDYFNLATISFLGSLGLFGYMYYLNQEFHDPLYFLHVQSEFGAGRSDSFVIYPQVVWRYLKILATYQAWDWRYYSYLQEFVVGVGGFLALLISFKYVRVSYAFFSLAVFLVPTLTGNFSSMPRYTLASFALFLLLTRALKSRGWLAFIYLLGSLVLLIINTMLFIQGYWIA